MILVVEILFLETKLEMILPLEETIIVTLETLVGIQIQLEKPILILDIKLVEEQMAVILQVTILE